MALLNNLLSERSYFPESMLVEVLSRLPVKSLMRFRCVSKSWCSLISSPEFISTHLKNYASTHLLLHRFDKEAKRWSVYLLPPTPSCMNANFIEIKLPVREVYPRVDSTFRPDNRFCRVYGPFNGIVCIVGCDMDKLALWNPATREFKAIPPSTIDRWFLDDYFDDCPREYGFGYDAKTNDYKVLQTLVIDTRGLAQYELYSLRTNSWKKLEPPNNPPPCYNSSDRKGSVLHLPFTDNYGSSRFCWLYGYARVWEGIVLFDMSDEKFDMMQLPPELALPDEDYEGSLVPFKESSIAFVRNRRKNNDNCIDIWVTDAANSSSFGSSWAKWLSISIRDFKYPLWFCEDGRYLLYLTDFTRNNAVVILNNALVLYDLYAQETKHYSIGREKIVRPHFGLDFKESLVPISSLLDLPPQLT